jgi:hypothetical protein
MGPRFQRSEPGTARRTVATFDTYAEAEQAVDFLADQQFPVERTAIVARDLEYVEQVTGRMTYARAALLGAGNGALIGFLVGWLFGLFNWFDPVVAPFWLAVDGLWFGALVGASFGLFVHALAGGRRDFSSVGAFQAKHYDVVVDEPLADEAERLLGGQQPTATERPVDDQRPINDRTTSPSGL